MALFLFSDLNKHLEKQDKMKLFYLHLLQALRNMQRNYLQTFLSLVGLTIGLSSLAFGFNWFWYETHYDSFRPDYRNIHLVCNHNQRADWFNYSQPYPMFNLLRDSFPGVTDVAIMGGGSVERLTDLNDENLFAQNFDISVTDPGFLKFMGVELLYGDAETALNRVDGIVVTQRMANQIFQRENVLGEALKIKRYGVPDTRIYTITGVAEDCYTHTAIPFDGLMSFENIPEENRQDWDNYNPVVFFKAVNVPDVDRRLRRRFVNGKSIFFAIPFTQMRATGGLWDQLKYPVCALVVSFLLFASALFNYIAILTTQFISRFREYKLRICLGSTFGRNLLWLYSEVSVMCVLTILGAGMLLEVIAAWSDMTEINSSLFRTFVRLAPAYCILLIVAALYPAVYLRHTYRRSFSGQQQVRSGKAGMLLVQMLVCALFIFVFVNAYRQFYYMTHTNLGFRYERVIRLFTRDNPPFNAPLIESILQELRSRGGSCIEEVVSSPSSIFQSRQYQGVNLSWEEQDGEAARSAAIHVPPQVFRFFGIRPVAGKIYEREVENGIEQIMLNKDAAELIRYPAADGVRLLGNGRPVAVAGVVDFYARNFRDGAFPVVYRYTEKEAESFNHEVMFIRYKKDRYDETMQLVEAVLRDRQIPLENLEIGSMDAYIAEFYAQEAHMIKMLSMMFVGSILITLLGVLSQITYTLRMHRRFIAVRCVFGATYIDLCRRYLRDYILLAVLACTVAIPAGYHFISNWLQSYRSSVGVGWFECFWIGGVLVVLVAAIILIRLWKALNENPSQVIRGE